MADTATITSASFDTAAVRIQWSDGHHSTLHSMWLRDNCACADCGPHATGSRLQRLLDIPDDVAPATVVAEPDTLAVTWDDDGHQSVYTAHWLRTNAYSPTALRDSHKSVKTVWDGTLTQWPTVEWDKVLTDDTERRKLHVAVAEFGFVLLRGLGTDHDGIEKLADEIGYLRETHYGKFFDLITRAEPQILADLAGPILPHTDEAYRRVPTGINIFHCIKPSPCGGGVSQLVDAYNVARILRERDPEAYELLTRVPVQHQRRIEDQVITSDLPAILLDHEGEVVEVRLNERTMTAIRVDEDLMEETYAALRTAFRIAYEPAQRIEYTMAAGDALLFDNLRVLHARTGYNGDRHVRQCQVMRDEFFAKGVALSEKTGLFGSVQA
ncbi:gamma-butyrobetaine dioxygenase/trimethyllysine dioxygenase [Streptomyces sp. PanSC19]|uniref:TauD/TfdA family dioxygenase n=1 Tax=Streptomyces sp. PanSC19 TaxID=1520455 RepID=UPI000F4A6A76|nr:TauD/TfdA family dioxygenase [Streptomyces sp. PanSC19]ROQ35718.1 gamma-butyrobetaine dioxygenase/trimethyllysine dioxygenase [Streptomyces sp. PanSC19]